MPRPINVGLRERMLDYLKAECIKAGGAVSPSMETIAEAVTTPDEKVNTNAVMRMIKILEQRGNIRVHRFEGSIPNQYEYVGTSVKDMKDVNAKTTAEIDSANAMFSNAFQEMLRVQSSLVKENQNNLGQLMFVNDMLKKLTFFGTDTDGNMMFKFTRESSLLNYVEKIKSEAK